MKLLVKTTTRKMISAVSALMAMNLHCFLMASLALTVPSTDISGV